MERTMDARSCQNDNLKYLQIRCEETIDISITKKKS